MAAYTITVRDGFVLVEVSGPRGRCGLGLRPWMARQRAGLNIWANWLLGLVHEGQIPLALAESVLDTLEARAEAQLPKFIRWIRGPIVRRQRNGTKHG